MDRPAVRILLVDDNQELLARLRELLEQIPSWDFHLQPEQTLDDALRALEQRYYDLCFLCASESYAGQLDLLGKAQARDCAVPIIMLLSQQTRMIGGETLRLGAVDYLLSSELTSTLLERAIRYSLRHSQVLTALKESKHRQQELEDQLLYDAFHDTLTRLPNKALFLDRLGRAIQRTKRQDSYSFAVLFFDLDRFKTINDSLGHPIGDQLLLMIARRLEASLRTSDTVARLGGDEFVILLDDVGDVGMITAVVERIQNDLSRPLTLGEHELVITASIGIATSRTGYHHPDDVLRDADIAMYRAKTLGKARYELFDQEMHTLAIAYLELETSLRRAIENQEFRLYYQPIVAIEPGEIVGFETLLRWHHPQRGVIPPAEFLALAEETGLIVPLGRWVLQEGCRQLRSWQEQFPREQPLTISVNLSNKEFWQPALVGHIAVVLEESGLDPSSLMLEITEGVIMENSQAAMRILQQLHELYIQLHIDDFGTGYSSLGALHRFSLNALKIDRSFISRMGLTQGNGDESLELVRMIILIGEQLGMEVIGEGVEHQAQLARLHQLGCQYAQGYYFSVPVDQQGATALLARNPRWPVTLEADQIASSETA